MRFASSSLLVILLLAGASRADESPLRYLPSDTRMVLTVHVGSLAREEMISGERLLRQMYFGRLVPEIERPGALPWGEVRQVILAWPFAGTLASVIVLDAKMDRKAFETQLRQVARTSKDLTVEEIGSPAVPVFRRRIDDRAWLELAPQLAAVPAPVRKLIVPQEVYVAAPDDHTLFVSLVGRNQVVRALRSRPPKSRLRTPDELTKLLRARNSKDVASFALLNESLNPAIGLVVEPKTRETFEQFEHITARIRGGKQIGIDIQVLGKTSALGGTLEATAAETLRRLEKNVGKVVTDVLPRTVLEGLFGRLKVNRKEAIVTITGQLDEGDARKLLPLLGGAQKKGSH